MIWKNVLVEWKIQPRPLEICKTKVTNQFVGRELIWTFTSTLFFVLFQTDNLERSWLRRFVGPTSSSSLNSSLEPRRRTKPTEHHLLVAAERSTVEGAELQTLTSDSWVELGSVFLQTCPWNWPWRRPWSVWWDSWSWASPSERSQQEAAEIFRRCHQAEALVWAADSVLGWGVGGGGVHYSHFHQSVKSDTLIYRKTMNSRDQTNDLFTVRPKEKSPFHFYCFYKI